MRRTHFFDDINTTTVVTAERRGPCSTGLTLTVFGGHASLETAERMRIVGYEVYPQFGFDGDESRQFEHFAFVAAIFGTLVLVAGNQLHVIVTATVYTHGWFTETVATDRRIRVGSS